MVGFTIKLGDSMVWIDREVVLMECPFCHKKGVEYLYHPASISAKTSRSAVARSTKFVKTGERYELISGCKFCGKSKKEIRKAMKEGTPQDREKRKKRYEEVMKVKTKLRRNIRIEKLFTRNSYIEADGFSSRQLCALVGGLHYAGTTARTDIKPLGRLLYFLRPGSDTLCELDTGFVCVTYLDGFIRHYCFI